MKINTWQGKKDIDKVFQNIPDEVYLKLKENMSISDVLNLIEKYEKPIKILNEYSRLKSYKRKNKYILNRINYLEIAIQNMKHKNRWDDKYILELKNRKLERYYLREDYIENTKGYTREPYKWRTNKIGSYKRKKWMR